MQNNKVKIMINDAAPVLSQLYLFGARAGDMVWVNSSPGGVGPQTFTAELRLAMAPEQNAAPEDYRLLEYEGEGFSLTTDGGSETNHRVIVSEGQYALVFTAVSGNITAGINYNVPS